MLDWFCLKNCCVDAPPPQKKKQQQHILTHNRMHTIKTEDSCYHRDEVQSSLFKLRGSFVLHEISYSMLPLN
jgi:hypothetical protein